MLKRSEVMGVREKRRKVVLNFTTFLRFLKEAFSKYPLHSVKGVTDFSQENF